MRSKEWHKIWDQRILNLNGRIPLHVIDGFENIKNDEWDNIVHFFCKKLGLNGNESILEIGCGSGAFLSSVQKKYKNIDLCGFDMSENIISIAKEEVNGLFFVINALDMEWGISKKFDVIFSFSVFHYFDDLFSSDRILRNCLGLLKENGKIMVGDVPDKKYEEEDKKIRQSQKRGRDGTADHMYYDKDFFVDFSHKHNIGLEIIDHRDCLCDYFPNYKFRYSVIFTKGNR